MRRVLLVCVLGFALVACSRDRSQPNTTTRATAGRPSPTTTPTASLPSAEQAAGMQATAAYLGLQRAFGEASKTANYQAPDIAKYAGDPARQQLTKGLFDLAQQGIVTIVKGPAPRFSPVVASVKLTVSPPEVIVNDCVDTRGVYFVHKKDGSSAEPTGAPYQPHRRHPATAVVDRVGGRWLVVRLTTDQKATC
jgi:hypothetical protein